MQLLTLVCLWMLVGINLVAVYDAISLPYFLAGPKYLRAGFQKCVYLQDESFKCAFNPVDAGYHVQGVY